MSKSIINCEKLLDSFMGCNGKMFIFINKFQFDFAMLSLFLTEIMKIYARKKKTLKRNLKRPPVSLPKLKKR